MKKNSWTYTCLCLVIGVIISIAVLLLVSWGLTSFWNNLVVSSFDNIPTVEMYQMTVVLLGMWIVKELIKFW